MRSAAFLYEGRAARYAHGPSAGAHCVGCGQHGWSREDIRHILFEYGEERYAPLIAAAIERERGKKPIETTLELVDIIRGAMPERRCAKSSIRPSAAFRPSVLR